MSSGLVSRLSKKAQKKAKAELDLGPSSRKKRKIHQVAPIALQPKDEAPELHPESTLLQDPPNPSSASSIEAYAKGIENIMQSSSTSVSKSAVRNMATAGAWRALLPSLVYPLMEQERAMQSHEPVDRPQCACSPQAAQVLVVSFTTITPTRILHCKCTHPAVALIRQGAFTSTPVHPPKWAFDLRYLAFVREQFLAGTPNFSAWCSGTVMYLEKLGCKIVPSASTLTRPLSSSLHHYQLVLDRIRAFVDQTLQNIPSAEAYSTAQSPPEPAGPCPSSNERSTAQSSLHRGGSTSDINTTTAASLVTTAAGPSGFAALATKEVQNATSMAKYAVDDQASAVHQSVGDRPSPHLQKSCPLCFGMTLQMLENILGGRPDVKKERFAALVCLDGNFDHRRLRHAGSGDQPIPKAFTYMLSATEVAATKQATEDAVGKKQRPFADDEAEDPDVTLPGLGLPEHIYSGCKKRFFAANQDNKKGEPSVFSDTGLMALVCRHDRVLFMANLRDAGERRYYALALLKRMFQELPISWTAGVLYDIGCQLHRTITKHDLVPEFSTRVGWGVSVFHAFGHEAACQALYHPQKCNGFGCTDGEGCERCWALLQKLTGVLRVSGFHRRLHILDQHIRYMNDSNYANLGLWLRRKMDAVVAKKAVALARIELSGRSETALCLDWKGQKMDAIERAPSASKTAAAKTASGIISMMDSLQQLDGLIKAAGTATTSEQGSPELLNLSLTLEDLAELRTKLQLRIQKAVKQLFGKDAATASAVQKSMKSDFLMKRMRVLAIRLKIKQQVRDVLLMSEPFRRRTSRDRKDAKIRQQTANSISRKTPGIKALARRYNSMCQELAGHPRKRYYPNASIPLLLDIAELFNPEANAAMWMDSASDDSDPVEAPPAYLTDPDVQNGILGWLGMQRCKEEERRLLGEMRRLVSWISEEIDAVDKAMSLCEDPALLFQLERWRQRRLSIGSKWMHDLTKYIAYTEWSDKIPLPKGKQKAPTSEEEGEDADGIEALLVDGEMEELELDDQHADFLSKVNLQEEDEVEKMLGKVAECFEEMAVDLPSDESNLSMLFA